MRSSVLSASGWVRFRPCLTAMCLLSAAATLVAAPPPPPLKAILPAGATFVDGSWSGSGTMASGNLHADLIGFEPACDPTLSNDIRIDVRGDSDPGSPMAGILEPQQQQEADDAARSLAKQAAGRQRQGGKTVVSVGPVKDEKVPGGRIVYVEYVESCAKHANRPVTMMQAFGRSGGFFAHAFINTTGSAAETRKVALDMLARFQQFRGAPTGK